MRVSVIVPCHNNEQHIAEALSSLRGQTRPPDEIIVVDDGSTDASTDRVAAFGAAVTLLRQPNRGVASARNAGVQAARGDFIAFLDGDDAWPCDSLALRLARLRETGAEMVHGVVRQCLVSVGADARSPGPAMPGRLAGALLLNRALFERVGLFDESLSSAETIDWLSRAQAAGVMEAAVPEVVLWRRIHGANMMMTRPDVDLNALAVLRRAVARRRAAS
jgi:glycosyltransferase involved in cell wall biosynthesis